jgi:hypothetical protein
MTELPSDGPDRELLLRALRKYADECRSPQLTPGCPYYRMSSDIGPYCADECMDLLGRHPSPDDGIELDNEFRAIRIRHRTRRQPPGTRAPFDARQLALEDEARPLEERRAASLLVTIQRVFQSPPDAAGVASQVRRIMLLAEELERRGFAAEQLIRTMFLRDRAHVIASLATLPLMLGINEDSTSVITELRGSEFPQVAAWRSVILGEDRTLDEWYEDARSKGAVATLNQVGRALSDGASAAHAWFASRSIAAAMTAEAPERSRYIELLDEVPPTATDQDLWIVDRFTVTYLDNWNQESLLREYRYLHGECEPPCSSIEMRSRSVDLASLTETISSNAARGRHGRINTERSAADLVPSALTHIADGKYDVAAAIFDAHRRAFPSDAQAHNNFGFCMMPLDLSRALPALEQAAELGMRLALVNIANRMLTLRILGRFSTALELAERAVGSTAWKDSDISYLWAPIDEPHQGWTLEPADARLYIADLAISMAAAAGDQRLLEAWRTRRSQVETG